jgi:hypothetical protein
MADGKPAWIPPPHLDPDQKPMRNHLHNPTLTTHPPPTEGG